MGLARRLVLLRTDTLGGKLFLCTARVESYFGARKTTATAFLYSVPAGPQLSNLFLVSNRHVFEGADRIYIHVMARGLNGPLLGQVRTVEVCPNDPEHAVFCASHADPVVDISVINFGAFLNRLEAVGTPAYLTPIPANVAFDQGDLGVVSAIEDVIFIGYPAGVFDSTSHLPVLRSGTTASPIEVEYEGKPAFLIDGAVFPGSSGSPVILLDRSGIWQDRNGGSNIGSRFLFLGVLAAVHTRQLSGQVIRLPASMLVRVKQPIGLGLVFKASAIDRVVDLVLARNGQIRWIPPGT